MKKLLLLFILAINITLSQVYIIPEAKIIDDTVRIFWKTSSPTGRAIVVYSPDDGIYSSSFPDYYEKVNDKKSDSIHLVTLSKIENNKIYNYRVSCVSTKSLDEYRSLNFKFKLITKNGKQSFGCVIIEGPIVSNITYNSVTISWKTNLLTNNEIEVIDLKTNQSKIYKSNSSVRSELIISDLKPDAEYKYRVKSSSDDDIVYSNYFKFRTAPEKNSFKKFRFAVMSDGRAGVELDFDARINGVNYLIVNKLAEEIRKAHASLVLFAGDLIGGSTNSRREAEIQYQTYKQAVSNINSSIPIYASIGNHDALAYGIMKDKIKMDPPVPNSNEDIWKDELSLPTNSPKNADGYPTYNENVYSFDYGDVHFVCLNSDYFYCYIPKKGIIEDPFAVKIDHIQRKWFEEDLQKNMNKKIVVFFHSPAYPAGGHIGSGVDRFPNVRDSVWNIIDKYNVKLVFNGHEHNYSRTIVDRSINKNYKNKINQLVVGRAGAPSYAQDMSNPFVKNVVRFSRKNHYVIVDVEKDKLLIKAIDENNNVLDQFEVK